MKKSLITINVVISFSLLLTISLFSNNFSQFIVALRSSMMCTLKITTTYSENCTEPTANNFTADWNIGIEVLGAPDNAISYQRNSDAVQTHTLTGTTDTLTITGIPADGGIYDTLKVWLTNETTCADTVILKRPVPCPTTIPISYPCAGNFALEGITSASSEAFGGFAAAAIDGQQTGDIHHSANEIDPWWQVTLAQNITIDSILIWNRTGQTARLNGAIIEVLDDVSSVVFTTTITTANASPALENIQTGGVIGRTVRIRHNSGANQILNFFEVEVFGNTTCTGGAADMCNLSSASNIVGSVWNDVNYNGVIDESNPLGIQGVAVQLYDCDGNLVVTSYTDTNGNYQFTGLTSGTAYRVEFNLPSSISCWAKPTAAGADNGTSVQFVQPGDCANLGLSNPNEYCQTNPPLATNCYLSGDVTDPSASGDPAFLSIPYNSSGDSPTTTYIADIPEIGSTWGIAYDKDDGVIYTAAVLKRHTGLKDGLGVIYQLDKTGATAPTQLYDFGALAGSLGVRSLGGQTDLSEDSEAFYKVGRAGLGDIDIASDNKTLYVSNLADNTIYTIDTDNPTTATALPAVPNPNCSITDETPWLINIGYTGPDTYTSAAGSFEPWDWEIKYTAPYGRGNDWHHGSSPVTNNTDAPDEIFASSIYFDNNNFMFPVPNGTYDVSLYFMDNKADPIGSSVMDVYVDGALFLDDFDPKAIAGQNVAIQRDITVTVTDGMLGINFIQNATHDVFSGVKIVRNGSITPTNAYRIWGLKTHDAGDGERLYAGVVCAAENSGHKDDLSAHVYAYDPNTSSWSGPMLSFPLNYERQGYGGNSNFHSRGWHAWSGNYFDMLFAYSEGTGGGGGNFAQPILSDIEFTSGGDMILGFLDRGGMQMGSFNNRPGAPYGPGGGSVSYVSAGDILRAGKNNSRSWTIENDGTTNGIAGTRTTASTSTPAGPGGKEFFGGEKFLTYNHYELSFGGIAFYPNTSEVPFSAFDPTANLNSGGILWLDELDGSFERGAQLYDASLTGNFAKGVGLGDIELLCSVAPLEIGNYVWEDTDGDGIQDACELGIDSVLVELFKGATLIATTKTTNLGQYYFSDKNALDAHLIWSGTGIDTTLLANTAYTVRISNAEGGSQQDSLSNLFLTTTNTNGNNSDNIDNDGIRNGTSAEITATTGDYGDANHSFDFGFRPPFDYGDLPDIANGTTGINDYETYDATGGPSHRIITGLFLGDTVDVDNDGFPHAEALGDDNDGADDEDGVTIFPNLNASPGGTIRLPISVTNTTGDTAYVEAWIDWNGDGDFDLINEVVADLKDNEDGVFPTYLTIPIPVTAITGSLVGFRIRLSNTDNMTPYGRINSGEVEDYLLGIECEQVCLSIEVIIKKE